MMILLEVMVTRHSLLSGNDVIDGKAGQDTLKLDGDFQIFIRASGYNF